MSSRSETHAVRAAIGARKVAAVTESLPNFKTGNPLKRVAAMEARLHAAYKAMERHKPCVVMKRTDSIYTVLTIKRLTAEFRSSLMSQAPFVRDQRPESGKPVKIPRSRLHPRPRSRLRLVWLAGVWSSLGCHRFEDRGISRDSTTPCHLAVFHYLGSAKIVDGVGNGLAEVMAELKQFKQAK